MLILSILCYDSAHFSPVTKLVTAQLIKDESKQILIAVGGRPAAPDIPGIEHAIDSREILNLKSPPNSFLIAGGGYIGVEFGGH